MPGDRHAATRAEALRRAAQLAAGTIAASSLGAPGIARAEVSPEARESIVALERLIQLERGAAAAYDAAARRGLLGDLGLRGPVHFRDQELRHADALVGALERLGGTEPPTRSPEPAPDLERGRSADVGRVLIELEELTLAAYLEAQGSLRGGGLVELLAGIMAVEGQHVAMLRAAVNREPVPSAFETGG